MSWTIWTSGPCDEARARLTGAVCLELRGRGYAVQRLGLAETRAALFPDAEGTDREDRLATRALGWTASLLNEAAVPALVDAGAAWRPCCDATCASIPRLAEVLVTCADEGTAARAGLADEDDRAGAGAYELAVDLELESLPEAAHRVADLGAELAACSGEAGARSTACAIWVTGRPGSGKTTVTSHVVGVLADRAVCARVLDLGEARHRILSGQRGSEAEQAMLHRALAYAAKCLAQAGVTAIVDATAARRAWRQAARDLIPGFAEVQLVCPEAVCLERERAARWGLGGAAPPRGGGGGDGSPDVAIDYEESLSPELVVRTDVLDPRDAARHIVRLIERLAVAAEGSGSAAAREAS